MAGNSQVKSIGCNARTIQALAIGVLVLGVGAFGLASYTFFIILPPALDSVNSAAWNLISFNPENNFHSGAEKLLSAGNELRSVGKEVEGWGWVPGIGQSLSGIGNNLDEMGSQVKSLAADVEKTGSTFDTTVDVIHSVGHGALGLKDGLYYGVMTMLVLGTVGVMTGIALLVVGNTIVNLQANFSKYADASQH
jgi:hypothetical protein